MTSACCSPRPRIPTQGNITNILDWRLLDEGIDGRLEVGCDYKFDPRGRMDASLLIHRLVPKKMPSDPQELVKLLRRAMPHELFNPDGHALETTVKSQQFFLFIYCSVGASVEGGFLDASCLVVEDARRQKSQ